MSRSIIVIVGLALVAAFVAFIFGSMLSIDPEGRGAALAHAFFLFAFASAVFALGLSLLATIIFLAGRWGRW